MGKNNLDKIGVQVPISDCPDFGYPASYIQAALDAPDGKVKTGGVSCGGVALQRVDCLTVGRVISGDYCKRVGGLGILQFVTDEKPCLPRDLQNHFKKQNYDLRKVRAKSGLQAHLERRSGPAVVCCGPACNAHWVTVFGMHNQIVYWIDYEGIFHAPLGEFLSITSSGTFLIDDDALLVLTEIQPPPVKKRRCS